MVGAAILSSLFEELETLTRTRAQLAAMMIQTQMVLPREPKRVDEPAG